MSFVVCWRIYALPMANMTLVCWQLQPPGQLLVLQMVWLGLVEAWRRHRLTWRLRRRRRDCLRNRTAALLCTLADLSSCTNVQSLYRWIEMKAGGLLLALRCGCFPAPKAPLPQPESPVRSCLRPSWAHGCTTDIQKLDQACPYASDDSWGLLTTSQVY